MITRRIEKGYPEASGEGTVQLARSADRFFETLKQSLLALSFVLGSLFAGSMFVSFSGSFSSVAWVLTLYPSILSVRGVIGGLFTGRLSTGLHLGTVRTSLTGNTKGFYLLLHSTITLTLQSSLMIGGMASLLSVVFWATPPIEVFSIFSAAITTMCLSILFVSPVTLGVSALAFKHGLDPDIVVYPVMSTIADVVVTACYIFTLELLFSFGYIGSLLAGLLDLAFFFVVLLILLRYRNEREFAETLRQFFSTLVAVTLIVNVTGNVLGRIGQVIGSKRQVLFVYPSVISTVGAVGSIVGSTMTTKLALGTVEASFTAVRRNLPEIGGACVSSAILFAVYAVVSSYFTRGVLVLDSLLALIAVLLVLNLLAAPLMSVVAYCVAVLTYRRGLNPDNFVIPFESSLSDTVTTICLLGVLSLFGALGAAV